MSERYSKLFALPENLYAEGAPVVIAAGALLKDNQTGKVLTQLKIQNIQDKAIKAATVKIVPLDTVGKPLGDAIEYQYLDLNAVRDTDFGQKTPIALPDTATRAFSAMVAEVIFSDNTVWTASHTPWEALSAPVPLEQALQDRELVKQYRIKYGENCKYIFKTEKDLWRCACGILNHQDEPLCHFCQKEAAVISDVDVDALKAERNERLAREKTAAAARSKKTKILAIIAVPIIAIAIVAGVLISKSTAYNAALELLETGEYAEAIDAFVELGDYKNSQELIVTTVERALGFPPNDESYKDIFNFSYDAEKKTIIYSLYLDKYLEYLLLQGYSKEDIQAYGEDNESLSSTATATQEEISHLFSEMGIDIPFQVYVYESANSTTPVITSGADK